MSAAPTQTFQAPNRFSRLAGDSFAYSLGNFVGKGVALLLLPIVARSLDPDGFGRLETLSTAFTAGAALLLLGFDVASARAFTLMPPLQRRAVTSTWLVIAIVLGFGATILGFALQSQIARTLLADESFDSAARWIGPIIGVSLIRSFVLGTLRNEHAPWQYALVNGTSLSLTAALMAAAATSRASVESLLVAQAVGVGFVSSIGLCYVSRFVTLRPSLNALKLLVRLGVPLAPLIGLVAIGDLAIRTILLRTADEAEVGILGVAIRIGSILTICSAGAIVAFQPRAFDLADKPGSKDRIGQDIERIFAILCVGGVLLAVLTPALVDVIGGESYRSSSSVAGLVLVSALGAAMFQFLSIGLMVDGRTGRISLVSAVGVATTVLFVVWLSPLLGAIGAASGMALGSWMTTLLLYGASRTAFLPSVRWVRVLPLAVSSSLSILLSTAPAPLTLKVSALVLMAVALRSSSVVKDGLALLREVISKRRIANA